MELAVTTCHLSFRGGRKLPREALLVRGDPSRIRRTTRDKRGQEEMKRSVGACIVVWWLSVVLACGVLVVEYASSPVTATFTSHSNNEWHGAVGRKSHAHHGCSAKHAKAPCLRTAGCVWKKHVLRCVPAPPTLSPTSAPTQHPVPPTPPTRSPVTKRPSNEPTFRPSRSPTPRPTKPTKHPTHYPSRLPTFPSKSVTSGLANIIVAVSY